MSNRSSSSNCKGTSGKYINSLNFFYTNATSLVNKWSDFNSLISFHDFPHVAGDLNFPDISWSQDGGFCTNKGRPSSLQFLKSLGKNYLTQHVLEPTFKCNILDLVITNDSSRVFRVSHGPPLGSTDKDYLHAMLSWCYELRSQPIAHTDSTPRQILSLGNYELFSERIRDSTKLLEKDINTAYSQLVKSYCAASSIAIPTRLHHARLRHSPKWFNVNIKKLTKIKYKLHCQIRSAPHNPELRASYALACKRVKSAVRHSICKFEASIVRVCVSVSPSCFLIISTARSNARKL